jgi:ADP-ribose pyrophosphatase YjhB (NUDIX family)
MSILSAWWIIYHKNANHIRFLIIKRQSLSKKIEWIAPKWKIKTWEDPAQASLREIVEETWLQHNKLYIASELWSIEFEYGEQKTHKEVTYFLVEYLGNMDDIKLQDWEWFLGIYKRATLREVFHLVTFYDLRLLYKKAFDILHSRDSF